MQQRVKLAYFGYSVEFTTSENRNEAIRTEANSLILSKFGATPNVSYVEPGIPFPSYVPVQRYDAEDGCFY